MPAQNAELKDAIFARQEQILKGIARQDSIMKVMTPGRPAFEKAALQKAALQMEQAELASDPATWSEEKINMIRAKLLPTSGGRRKRRTHKRTLRKHKLTLRNHKRRTHRR